ncbi:cyclic nucleotide-binding domain-containing protein 2-like [Patiria miniata]|uniref:Cyclic nucleotide-binding domain-containing protein n=1 Tax=Patiria miniata TaxID=46514 RepID=A0A914A093_PATMI|nr:cyclic nucleotide-binding domain-containing protein 2-like [Patiria miniata]
MDSESKTNLVSGEDDDEQDYMNPALKKRRGATITDVLPSEPPPPPPPAPVESYSGSSEGSGEESEDQGSGQEDGAPERADERPEASKEDGHTEVKTEEAKPSEAKAATEGDEPEGQRGRRESSVVDVQTMPPLNTPPLLHHSSTQRRALQSARTPLERFRAIANTIKHNLKWAKMLSTTKQEGEQKSYTVEHEDGHDTSLTFNVNAFKANVQSVSTLPAAVKLTMRKNPWERSPKDLAYIFSFVDKLKCFERYSTTAKQELSCVLHFESFEDGRVIVKQGHPGLSFYFILSGAVTVEVTEEDKRTGERNTHMMGEHTAGSSFGELSLLHGSKRTATISCKGDAEFLILDKPDFDQVLRRSYQQEWDTRMSALRSLAALGHWSEEELSATNDRAKLVEFPPNTPIISDLAQAHDDIYFVKSGTCKIVREVTLLQSKLPFGDTKLSLPPLDADHNVPDSFKPEKHQRLIRKLLHIANIGRGKFFGVGEDLRRTHIISSGKVECILVSRVSFMRHDRGKSLESMQQMVEQLYPSYEETFTNYLQDKRWRAYKHGLVKELMLRRNIPNNTTIEDVPLILRQDNKL